MTITASNLITNKDAKPPVFTEPGRERAKSREIKPTVTTPALVALDTLQICKLRSNDIIDDILFTNTDLDSGATGTADLGIYAADGITAVDDDIFASADVQLRGAITAWASMDVTRAATLRNKQLWEVLSLTEDPKVEYTLVLLANAAFNTAGTIAFRVLLSDPQ